MTFNPLRVEVHAGARVTVELTNVDGEDHDFAITSLGKKLLLKPGAAGKVQFAAKKAGEYEIVCTLAGYKDAGMVGVLVVK